MATTRMEESSGKTLVKNADLWDLVGERGVSLVIVMQTEANLDPSELQGRDNTGRKTMWEDEASRFYRGQL